MVIHSSKESEPEGVGVEQSPEKGTTNLASKKRIIVRERGRDSYRDRDKNAAGKDRATATTATLQSPSSLRENSMTSQKSRKIATTTTTRRRKRKDLLSRDCFFVDWHHQMLVLYGPSYKEFVLPPTAAPSSQRSSGGKNKNPKPAW